MNTSLLTYGRGPFDGDVFSRIIDALVQDGYIILNSLFSDEQLQRLFIDIKQTESCHFHPAGIGRDQDHQLNRFVRRDRICWLHTDYEPVRFYLNWSEELRLRVNRELFLGLFDFECHYAHYPSGAFYKRHVDAFKGSSNRRLSSILYLNPDWQSNDGGELVIYSRDNQAVLETVSPTFGTLVLFLSEDFPHEVLTAGRSRYSLTGWFRINNTNSLNLDPPQ